MKNPDLHPLLGPHEGRELELMLKGDKPAAKFSMIIGSEEHIFEPIFSAFKPHVDAGTILQHAEKYTSDGFEIVHVYYALPQYRQNLIRLAEIDRYARDPKRDRTIPWPDDLERETGHLLGYPEKAIDFFVQHRKSLIRKNSK